MEMPRPSEQQKRLTKLFTGTWRGDETIHPSDLDPKGGPAIGTWSVTPSVDGFAILVDYTEQRGATIIYRGHGVHVWDARENCFFAFWFDNMGIVQQAGHRATLDGERYQYVTPMGPMGQSRMTYVFGDGTLRFTIERSKDGVSWSLFHEGSYIREMEAVASS